MSIKAGELHAGLIEVHHRSLAQQRAQLFVKRSQTLRGLIDPRLHGGGRELGVGQIEDQLAGTLIREVLKDVQIDAQRMDPGAVADRRRHARREAPGADLPAGLTAAPDRGMLDHPQGDLLGQVKHLTGLLTVCQTLSA